MREDGNDWWTPPGRVCLSSVGPVRAWFARPLLCMQTGLSFKAASSSSHQRFLSQRASSRVKRNGFAKRCWQPLYFFLPWLVSGLRRFKWPATDHVLSDPRHRARISPCQWSVFANTNLVKLCPANDKTDAVDMDIYGAFQLCSIGILAAPLTVTLSRTYFNAPGRNTIFLWTGLLLTGMRHSC